MASILDLIAGGGGLFSDRWSPVPQALNSGMFDVGPSPYALAVGGPQMFNDTGAYSAPFAPAPQAMPQTASLAGPQPMPPQPPQAGGNMPSAMNGLPILFGGAMGGGQGGGFLDNLNRALSNNSNMLIGLGGDIMSGGFRTRGLPGALAGAGLDQRQVGQTDDIKEYRFAVSQGFKGSLADWIARKRAGAGEYGLNAIWGTGPDNKPAIIQLGKSGEAISPKLPPGFVPSRGIEKVDTGDTWTFYDKGSGQVVGQQKKNIEAKEAAEERGKAQGQAQAAFLPAQATASRLLSRISDLEQHKGMSKAVGYVVGRSPIPLGTAAADFIERTNEIGSQAWTDAVKEMRGLGALSNAEGQRIETARARLSRAKSEADFKIALKDLREAIQIGMKNMRLITEGKMKPYPVGPATDDPLGLR